MAKGTITMQKLKILIGTVQEEFTKELAAMTGPKPKLSKGKALDIAAGHSDGMRNMIEALRSQGIIDVTE